MPSPLTPPAMIPSCPEKRAGTSTGSKSSSSSSALVLHTLKHFDAEHHLVFADPLKIWADLFAKQGKTTDVAKYNQALQYAPAWAELQQARASLQTPLAKRTKTGTPLAIAPAYM